MGIYDLLHISINLHHIFNLTLRHFYSLTSQSPMIFPVVPRRGDVQDATLSTLLLRGNVNGVPYCNDVRHTRKNILEEMMRGLR